MCCARTIATFFSKTLSVLRPLTPRPPFPVLFSPSAPSRLSLQSGGRGSGPGAGPHRSKRHFRRRFTSWLGGWSRAGARAGEGRRVSLRRAHGGSAGWRAPIAAPALAAAPPPLRVAGRLSGCDNVAGLVTGRRPLSILKFKLTRIALWRRRRPAARLTRVFL